MHLHQYLTEWKETLSYVTSDHMKWQWVQAIVLTALALMLVRFLYLKTVAIFDWTTDVVFGTLFRIAVGTTMITATQLAFLHWVGIVRMIEFF